MNDYQEIAPLNVTRAESGSSAAPGGDGYGGVDQDEEGGSKERSDSIFSLSDHKGELQFRITHVAFELLTIKDHVFVNSYFAFRNKCD
jgi:hypothetical protein